MFYFDRQSRYRNARRLASLGAGEFILPATDRDGEKFVSKAEFRDKVWNVLSNGIYQLRARQIADTMQQYGGVSQAADHIEAMVA